MAGQRLKACKQLELARLCGVLNGLGGWPARRKSRGGSPKGACDGRVKNRGCCGNLGKMRPRPPVPATTRSQAPAEQVGDASPERSRQPRAGSKRWAGYSGCPDQGSRIQDCAFRFELWSQYWHWHGVPGQCQWVEPGHSVLQSRSH